ncbi:hypothetical protein QJS83_16055 [Bdellovibrio sp. 22V]|uniref:hypothetical protein n=1 Tax=Bdellovibrio TaxID=958 RepID=UPI002542CD34|nr:hypothetical protein [Bdellovibrio sp. 22V]WII71977.1 hypothetical protein QJS83_16055 [Bdellovibrio sp. 22V]
MADKKVETVRGPELRRKIINSQRKGEEFRSERSGTDILDTNVKHDEATTRNRTIREHNSKKFGS